MSVEFKLNHLESMLEEVRKLDRELQLARGKFDEAFQGFLREQGLPEQFHLLDIIKHFRKAKSLIEV